MDSDISSDHSEHGQVPDLNANIIYEIEMAEPDQGAGPNAAQQNVVLALPAVPQVQVPHFDLNHEVFMPEEIQLDELLEDVGNNVEDMLVQEDGPKPMQHDGPVDFNGM